jgi:Secretion system C-terminal sorting domain/Outer membrane protein Omp28
MKKVLLLLFMLLLSLQNQAQVLLSENFDTALNWTVTHTTGTYASPGWIRATSGANPTCTPFSGSGMAYFNSYDISAGDSYSLRSSAITFNGMFYKVKFNMYRDAGNSGYADNIQVYYNSTNTLSGATLLKTVNRSSTLAPIVTTADGWYDYTANLPYGISGTGYVFMVANSEYGNNMFIDNISIEQNNTLNDASLIDVDLNSVLALSTISLTGSILNTASNPITSLDINWQLNSGTTNTQSLTGLNILPGTTYNFTHSIPWNANVTGAYSINTFVSNTNGNDTDLTNNSILKSGFIVNEIYPKTVVYEEGTGTWCGWCVRGHVGLKDMSHLYSSDNFIGIAVHNGDPMKLVAYDTAMSGFIGGYPSGIINRVNVEVDPGLSSLQPSYLTELAKRPLAKINISDVNWNPTTRLITFDATSKFALDLASANYNMAAIIVENGVTGTLSTYGQKNYYSGGGNGPLIDWEGINWSNFASTIPASAMVYNHVGRVLLGGFTGFSGSVPTTVTYNTPYNYSFSHTLSPLQNVNNIEVVAVLINNANGQIVNASNFDLGAKVTLATNSFETSNKVKLYPNPSTGIVKISTESNVQVKIIDILGKVVYSNNSVTSDSNLDLSNLQKGIYLVKVIGENVYATEKLILK